MKTKLIITASLFTLTQSLLAQTADGYVSQGRAFLSATNLIAANNSFSNAVLLSPNHDAANVFYAATRLLVLPSQPAVSNFLSRIGVPVAGRDIYNWTAILPTDANGVPFTPPGLNANESTSLLGTNILPAVSAAAANLAKVTDTNFSLTLTSNETRMVGVTLDYADILMLTAMLQAAEYFAYTTYSWNLDAQLAVIRYLHDIEQLSIERVLMDYPNLLTFATTNDLNAAKLAFQNGVDHYLQASQLIRARSTNVTRLFNYDASKAAREEQFRVTLIDLKNSLAVAITLAVETNYTVFMGAHFSGTHSMRSFLPWIRGNGFGLGTLPDSTFGGLIYGLTDQRVDEFLAQNLLPIPTIPPTFSTLGGPFQFPINVAKGRGYVVQVTTNLFDWADYSAFFALDGSYDFADLNAASLPHRFYRVVDRTGNMPPPSNDNFKNRIALSGLGIAAVGYNASASFEAGEPAFAAKTVWWSWISPFSGGVVIDTVDSTFEPYVRVYTGSSLTALSAVSSGYGRVSFTATAGTTYQIQVDGFYFSPKTGGIKLTITTPPVLTVVSPTNGAQFTQPANILISASASDADGSIGKLEFRGDGALLASTTNPSLSLTWNNVGLGFHSLQVIATDNLGVTTSSNLAVTVRPSNDTFANRILISGAAATVISSNNAASKEPGEPNHAGIAGGYSIWWTWTAPSNGVFFITAAQSGNMVARGYPLLAVYTGASVSNLTSVASNSVTAYGNPAHVSFTAAAGTAYQIAVDDQFGYNGDITLRIIPTQPPVVNIISPTNGAVLFSPANIAITANASDPDGSIIRVDFYNGTSLIGSVSDAPFSMVWSNINAGNYSLRAMATDNSGAFANSSTAGISVRLPNDNFANRIPISGASVTVDGTNNGATKELGEPNHAGYSGGWSVWWSWTAPSNRVVAISAGLSNQSGAFGYPLLGVYTGSSISNLAALASNAATSYGTKAQVNFNGTAGTTYQIAVDDRFGYVGNIVLNVVQTQLPVVTIVSPTNGSVFAVPTNITIIANASDPDGSVSRVDFYNGAILIGSVANAPYSMVWSNVSAGNYSLTAKATDSAGAFTYSPSVNVSIPQPPTTIALNIPLTNLSGSANSQASYKVTISAGRPSLQISISGGAGDCDLYVKFGSQPTLNSWDYRPYLGDNNESVTIPSPAAGDWYIMLHGYSSYSGVTLLAQ